MIKLTIEQFAQQWCPGGSTYKITSMFDANVFEFTTLAGNYSKRYFTTSFLSGGFYGSGTKWPSRTSRWGKKFTHPLMHDTGKLRSGIKGEAQKIEITGRRQDGTRINRRGARYDIWTTEKSEPEKGKRGRSTTRYRNYAAVHNTDPKYGLYTVNQHSSRRPEHRQFIGLNKSLDMDVARFFHIIFRGFPH